MFFLKVIMKYDVIMKNDIFKEQKWVYNYVSRYTKVKNVSF